MTNVVRIAHIPDIHLGKKLYGLKSLEEDMEIAYLNVIDDIIEKKVDLVLMTGDIFDQSQPRPQTLKIFQEGFLKLKDKGIEVVCIYGNHDSLRISGVYPIDVYKGLGINVLNKQNEGIYEFNDNLVICGLPYDTGLNKDKIHDDIDWLTTIAECFKHSILLLHQSVSPWMNFGPELDMDDIPLVFDYVGLGHIHERFMKKRGNQVISYSGSVGINSRTEIKDYYNSGKGYSLLTIDTDADSDDPDNTFEFVSLPLPRSWVDLTINIDNCSLDKELDKIADRLLGDFNAKYDSLPVVHLVVQGSSFNKSDVLDYVNKKLSTLCVILKLEFEYVNQNIDIKDIKLCDSTLDILENIRERFKNPKTAEFAVELTKILSGPNCRDADDFVDEFYRETYDKNN